MKIEVKSYTAKESLFNSLLFFILGAILVFNPNGIIKIIAYFLGGFFVIFALSKFLLYRKLSKAGAGGLLELASCIIFVALAIVCFAFFDLMETVFRFIAAFYILYIGINRLVFALKLTSDKTKNSLGAIITSSIMIVCGVLLCLIPGLPFRFIGLFIMGYSVMEMIGFVLFTDKDERNDKKQKKKSDDIEEAEIIEEVVNEDIESTKSKKLENK